MMASFQSNQTKKSTDPCSVPQRGLTKEKKCLDPGLLGKVPLVWMTAIDHNHKLTPLYSYRHPSQLGAHISPEVCLLLYKELSQSLSLHKVNKSVTCITRSRPRKADFFPSSLHLLSLPSITYLFFLQEILSVVKYLYSLESKKQDPIFLANLIDSPWHQFYISSYFLIHHSPPPTTLFATAQPGKKIFCSSLP